MSDPPTPANRTPAALTRLCPGCGQRDERAPVAGCPGCGLPRSLQVWIDTQTDDASGPVAASLFTAGALGVVALVLPVAHGHHAAEALATLLASPLLLGLGGWGWRERRAQRQRQLRPEREFRCTGQRHLAGGLWWVEAVVRLDARGAIAHGHGHSRRQIAAHPDADRRTRDQVPPSEWAALWLLALLESEAAISIDHAQEWTWTATPARDAPGSPEVPYRDDPTHALTWEHHGGQPDARVTLLDGLETLFSLAHLEVGADRSALLPLLQRPIALGLLVDRMRSATGGLDRLLDRCQAYLDTRPTSLQRRVEQLAALTWP